MQKLEVESYVEHIVEVFKLCWLCKRWQVEKQGFDLTLICKAEPLANHEFITSCHHTY